MVILSDRSIIKTSFENFNFCATKGEKLHKQVVLRCLEWPLCEVNLPKALELGSFVTDFFDTLST